MLAGGVGLRSRVSVHRGSLTRSAGELAGCVAADVLCKLAKDKDGQSKFFGHHVEVRSSA